MNNIPKKWLITIGVVFLFVISCKTPVFTIGMTEKEFTSKNKGVKIVEASKESTVYRKVNQPFGAPAEVRFFYFVNGRLDHIDEGVRTADVIIQHTK